MRRFLQLATVLLVVAVSAGSPLTTLSPPPAAAAVAAAPQLAAVSGGQGNPALICILPRCDGPYCRASNGCWVCCSH